MALSEWEKLLLKRKRARDPSTRCVMVGEKNVKTFHAKSVSIKTDKTGRAIARSAIRGQEYIDRVGEFAQQTGELPDVECSISSIGKTREEKEEFWGACEEQIVGVNRQVQVSQTWELPQDLDQEGRKKILQELAQWYALKGYHCSGAIHRPPNDETDNWHLHLKICPRRMEKLNGNWLVNWSRPTLTKGRDKIGVIELDDGKTKIQYNEKSGGPLGGSERVKAQRDWYAEICNKELQRCGVEISMSGKSFKTLGVDRPAKKRVPMLEYKRSIEAKSPAARVNASIDREPAKVQKARQEWGADRRAQRTERDDLAARHLAARAGGQVVQSASDPPKPREHWQEHINREVVRLLEKAQRKGDKEKSIKAGKDIAKRCNIVLPDGWDRDAGTAGAIVRILVQAKSDIMELRAHEAEARLAAQNKQQKKENKPVEAVEKKEAQPEPDIVTTEAIKDLDAKKLDFLTREMAASGRLNYLIAIRHQAGLEPVAIVQSEPAPAPGPNVKAGKTATGAPERSVGHVPAHPPQPAPVAPGAPPTRVGDAQPPPPPAAAPKKKEQKQHIINITLPGRTKRRSQNTH